MIMNKEQYRVAQGALQAIVALLASTNFNDYHQSIERAQAIGPRVDPKRYISNGDYIATERLFVLATIEYKEKMYLISKAFEVRNGPTVPGTP